MFNKLKQFKDLRHQAKTLQTALAAESMTYEHGGIKIVMNGNLEITSLIISGQIPADKLSGLLIQTVNEAVKRAQKVMAEKVRQLGGLGNMANF